jgi:hypothetical protein
VVEVILEQFIGFTALASPLFDPYTVVEVIAEFQLWREISWTVFMAERLKSRESLTNLGV